MINLQPQDLIGKGQTRSCYRHPHDPDKCIKIDYRKHGGPTEKEAKYYHKIARIRPDLSYTNIPRFHGFENTNLGRGGVFDLILDEITGEPSKSLSHYIRSGDVLANDPQWRDAHETYLKSLFDEWIIVRDFTPGNICVRRLANGGLQFVAIDGIGHRDFVPICDYFKWAAHLKLKRQINRKCFGSLEEIMNRLANKKRKAGPIPLPKPFSEDI